jgi:hypothetical protein
MFFIGGLAKTREGESEMNKRDFENLVASVKQAGKIKRGEMKASLTICKGSRPRARWAAAARRMHERGEDRLLDPTTATRFDEEEWKQR